MDYIKLKATEELKKKKRKQKLNEIDSSQKIRPQPGKYTKIKKNFNAYQEEFFFSFMKSITLQVNKTEI